MKLMIAEDQAENLKLDAKALIDISRMLEVDGRFKALPAVLEGIATDILQALCDGKEVMV